MITALSKREREYIIESDRKSKKPTVFMIRNIDRFETAELQSRFPDFQRSLSDPDTDEVVGTNISDMIDAYLKLGLVGWKNLSDSDGKPVKFSEGNFRLIPFPVANELVNKITGSISEDQAKNSKGQS